MMDWLKSEFDKAKKAFQAPFTIYLFTTLLLVFLIKKKILDNLEKEFTVGRVIDADRSTKGAGSLMFEYYIKGESYVGSHGYPYPLKEGVVIHKGQYWPVAYAKNFPLLKYEMIIKGEPCNKELFGKTFDEISDVICIE